MRVATTRMCIDDATTMKRWAPFGPPDEFDASNGTASSAWVLASKGKQGVTPGRAPGGRYGDHTCRAIGVTVFLTNT